MSRKSRKKKSKDKEEKAKRMDLDSVYIGCYAVGGRFLDVESEL